MPNKAIHVLLIDDDESDYLLTRDLLNEISDGGFKLEWQSTYGEGLQALCQAKSDICLLDYRLGARTGLDLLREAKEHGCAMPVIILTGQSERDIDFSAMELGAADYLEKKDLSAHKLVRAIRYALLKRRQSEELEGLVKERTEDYELANRTLQLEIGERQRTHAALLESELRFRHLADAMPQIVWISDDQGNMEFINRQWTVYTGLSLDDTRRFEQMLAVVHSDDQHPLLEGWAKARSVKSPYQAELRIKHAHDGHYRWFLLRSVPVFDEKGSLIKWYGTSTDINEHKLLETEQREANRRKDEFLASMGHELRNPLPPIRNALEIMRLSSNNPQAVERGRSMIERQLNQLVRLIDDLLDLSRFTRGKIRLRIETVELSDILDTAVETSRPLIEAAQHQLKVKTASEPVYFEGDATRLTQVVVNLLNNAAKYTEPKGKIILSGTKKNDQIVIQVQDNGIGIPADMIPHIFDIFTQDHRAEHQLQGGLGIGLALVRGIVQMHGGTVEAHSPGINQGSDFVVCLPTSQPLVNRFDETDL
jgi:PAS domain S-box-containing protein